MAAREPNPNVIGAMQAINQQSASVLANGLTTVIQNALQVGWGAAILAALASPALWPAIAVATIIGVAGWLHNAEQRKKAETFANSLQDAAGKVTSSHELLKRIADGRIALDVELNDLVKADLAEAVAVAVEGRQRPSLGMLERMAASLDMAKRDASHLKEDQQNLLIFAETADLLLRDVKALVERVITVLDSRRPARGTLPPGVSDAGALAAYNQWISGHIEAQVANAQDRYLPEINVDTGLTEAIDALVGSTAFFRNVLAAFATVNLRFRALSTEFKLALYDKELPAVDASIEQLRLTAISLSNGLKAGDVESASAVCSKLTDVNASVARQLLERPEHGERVRATFADLADAVDVLEDMLGGLLLELYQRKAMLLLGEAGQGKTHLFCHIATIRAARGEATLLFHGQDFDTGDLWQQMLEKLDVSCDAADLLASLDAAGRSSGIRSLILIDALNESADISVWNKQLPGVLKRLEAYAFVAIAVSVRTPYEERILSDKLAKDVLTVVEHRGFRGVENVAMRRVLGHYGIALPNVPLLAPEFSNPLFLITLCRGLQSSGQKELPSGYHGLTWVIDLSLDAANRKLAAADRLDFDPNERRVHSAVMRLAAAMADRGTKWLTELEAKKIIADVHPENGWSKSLFRALIDEGLLTRTPIRDAVPAASGWIAGARFTYERFTDQLVVRALLEPYAGPDDLRAAFQPGGAIHRMLTHGNLGWTDHSLLAAFAIQLPESFGIELPELLVENADGPAYTRAFIDSLAWRDPKSIGDVAKAHVETILSSKAAEDPSFRRLIDTLLTLAGRAEHPFNADYLHAVLMRDSMPERDRWWSRLLHKFHNQSDSVTRLIDWAWAGGSTPPSEESLALLAQTIVWFFTTSDRFVRDRATKALVALLSGRLNALRDVVVLFRNVDDLYVMERLLAVCYACALRSRHDKKGLGEVAAVVYDWIFAAGSATPAHILVRDYARGVMELAAREGVAGSADLARVRPPYGETWPAVPTRNDLEANFGPFAGDGVYYVWRSVMEDEDFARYTIGTNSAYSDWLKHSLSRPLPDHILNPPEDKPLDPEKLEAIQHFLAGLTFEPAESTDLAPGEVAAEEPRAAEQIEQALSAAGIPLNSDELAALMAPPRRSIYDEMFDLRIIQALVFQKVMDLGYTAALDEQFEPYHTPGHYPGRSSRKGERIGKKYQWIALHHVLGLVADNFHFRLHPQSRLPWKYNGPWQIIGLRDIDASCTVAKTPRDDLASSPTWWSPYTNTDGRGGSDSDNVDWMQNDGVLPEVDLLLTVHDPSGGSWIVAAGFAERTAAAPPFSAPDEAIRRQCWWKVRTYLVRSSDVEQVLQSLQSGAWAEHQLPGIPKLHCMLREFPDLPAFADEQGRYFERPGWSQPTPTPTQLHQAPMLVLGEEYFDDSESDCSLEGVLSLYLPCQHLVEKLGLHHASPDSHFVLPCGDVFAFDPSVTDAGPSHLLLRRQVLMEFAEKEGCQIIAVVYGEKTTTGHGGDAEKYEGRTRFSGALRLTEAGWQGKLASRFEGPRGK
jgi:hypothetical protein